mgnify:CR=1 FL=1
MGKRWDLQFCMVAPDSAGDCDAPHVPSKQIRIDQRLSGERQLEVILHEIRHAADWGQSEEFVDREAKDVARILWRLGYRKEA